MKIVITNNFEKFLNEISYDEVLIRDEFKMEDVQTLKEFSYLTSDKVKTIVVAANKFNLYSQNALLKLFEEPPKNIDFILLAPSKYALLDTIKSRLPLEIKNYEKVLKREIKLNNEEILKLMKNRDLTKEELKVIIYSVLNENLDEEVLETLNKAILMIERNINLKAILSLIYLKIKANNESNQIK